MRADPRIDFLIGGVQKAGTTALHTHLANLACVRMASVKEAHFFDDEDLSWSAPDYGRYHALFPPKDGRPAGEATPIYLYWPNCLERIARYRPDIRLILLFRDPVDRAWSHWRMEYARGWETQPFGWAIRDGRARVDSPEAPGFHRIFSYVERGFYGAQLERLLCLFPREHILLLRSDELRQRPDETLRRTCRFIGAVEPGDRVVPQAHEPAGPVGCGSAPADEDRAYLRGLFRADTLRFGELSGLSVADWL